MSARVCDAPGCGATLWSGNASGLCRSCRMVALHRDDGFAARRDARLPLARANAVDTARARAARQEVWRAARMRGLIMAEQGRLRDDIAAALGWHMRSVCRLLERHGYLAWPARTLEVEDLRAMAGAGMEAAEIARLCGCKAGDVTKAMRRHGVEFRVARPKVRMRAPKGGWRATACP